MYKGNFTLVIFCVFLAVMFQSVPGIFGEIFIFFTVLSTIPIYIISRLNPKLGIFALIAAGLLTMLFTIHEGIMFYYTNGAVGMALGIGNHYFNRKEVVTTLSGIYLTITLSILNYGLKIPVFGTSIPGTFPIQLLIIFSFSLVYSFMYLNLLQYLFDIFTSKEI